MHPPTQLVIGMESLRSHKAIDLLDSDEIEFV
jgi:hypothetical protein